MQQKTILLTGGAGYLGIHTAQLLIKNGWNVIVLDNMSNGNTSKPQWANIVISDYANENILSHIFKTNTIDTVIHLAAMTDVNKSVSAPLCAYQNNVSKTIRLLELMVDHAVPNIIFSSSAQVYGNSESANPLTEEHPLDPATPFAQTKVIIEQIIHDTAHAYNLQYVILRFSEFAGWNSEIKQNQSLQHGIIYNMLQALKLQKPFPIPGTSYQTSDGTHIKCYIHVADAAQAIFHSLQHIQQHPSETFNITTGQGYSVIHILKQIERLLNIEIKTIEGAMGPTPAKRILDPSKAQTILGWETRHSKLENIIHSMIKVMHENLKFPGHINYITSFKK